MSESASGSETTRDLASQRQPTDPPVEAGFTTPSWVGPDRHPELHRHLAETTIPAQAAPAHDAIEPPAPAAPEVAIVEQAHWVGSTTGRTALSLTLIALLIAALGSAALVASDPGGNGIVLLVFFVLCAAGLWAVLATTKPMVVDLRGSTLTVEHRNRVDTFDLADPFQPVEIRGALGSPTWSLALGRPDGSTVVVGSRTVRSAQLHPAVVHYRRMAERRRHEREERFGR